QCLKTPPEPLYGGGLVVNPSLDDGVNGWAPFGSARLNHAESDDGNKYVVASERSQAFDSFSQEFDLDAEKLYSLSAWIRVSEGRMDGVDVSVNVKTNGGDFITAGWVVAREDCWAMLKGGFVVDKSGPAHIFFQSNVTGVDIWADSISLQHFTTEEWESHRSQTIDRARKRTVKFWAVDEYGRPVENATVSITQTRSGFPLGVAINNNLIGNAAYQDWFARRFKYTVFENEMKWYATESTRGTEDYSAADALLGFAKSHGIAVRGHNVFWDAKNYQPSWVPWISVPDLWTAVNRRLNSVVGRYKGQLIHWDVVNESMHYRFFELRLSRRFSSIFFSRARDLDSTALPFLNEFNTIEESGDGVASPSRYLQKIQELRQGGYNGPLGIGLQGHFRVLNLPYVRAALDTLGSTGLPVWITELDVGNGPNQAALLDQILRELHAHPAVKGIIMWSAWRPGGCYRMCLTDNNFRNLPTGDVVDRILGEFILREGAVYGKTNSDGVFEASLLHGDYEVGVSHPDGDYNSDSRQIKISPVQLEEEE
ncbi:hypothetical protein M569_16258, partial [Genlisea aurea]